MYVSYIHIHASCVRGKGPKALQLCEKRCNWAKSAATVRKALQLGQKRCNCAKSAVSVRKT